MTCAANNFQPSMDPAALGWQSPALHGVSPVLRTLLLSDGTVTTFLEAYFGEVIRVDVHSHETAQFGALPALKIPAGTPVLRRVTTFRGAETGRIFCHALTYLRAELLWAGAAEELLQGRVGIGELLRAKRIETYREILSLKRTMANDLVEELALKLDDDVVARTYRVYVDQVPCLYIKDSYPVRLFD